MINNMCGLKYMEFKTKRLKKLGSLIKICNAYSKKELKAFTFNK